ncbi:sodium:proton antiporter [bacterium]|nr:sodium:proton antiporter [bacterium]
MVKPILWFLLVACFFVSFPMIGFAADIQLTHEIIHETHADHGLGSILPLWSVIPFAGILLSIAFVPLVAPVFWDKNFGKVSMFWALLLVIPYIIAYRGQGFHDLFHIILVDYIPFIILLWGLYTTTSGIFLRGNLRGTPTVNTAILLLGTILASWIGTTGAAMLLIRPLLRANQHRRYVTHSVVFFIFLVANIGGCLTPLGDPPLFLGFLHGVSLFWTTVNLLPEMFLLSAFILVSYFCLDTHYFHKENKKMQRAMTRSIHNSLHLDGTINLIFLAGIIGSVLMSGSVKLASINVLGVNVELQNWIRDVIIITMGLLSLSFTPKIIHKINHFTWHPMAEVSKLFIGIFITIVPALAILRAGENGALAPLLCLITKPWHFFWATGLFSSFLDNAPTYLTFFNTAIGKIGGTEADVPKLLGAMKSNLGNDQFIQILKAISCGAVFMGANTYIGNAPNFMVKSIAEENKIEMPSFFGYMIWSGIILLPLFLLITFEFFVI